MKYTFGAFRSTTVELINRQQRVEYEVLNGNASEREIRAALGNVGRSQYQCFYTGFYSERKPAIKRLEKAIQELEKQVDDMKFALKVTKKKRWAKVTSKDNKQ